MMIRLVVMGVAGCGKSTLGAEIAQAAGCRFVEGDDHHLPESRRKMHDGIALDDADREPWLDVLARLFAEEPGDLVISCSALKRRYRDRLRDRVPGLAFVYVEIDPGEAQRRVASRSGHFFSASLVDSQFATLEPPVGEPGVVRVAATDALGEQLGHVLRWLGLNDARYDA